MNNSMLAIGSVLDHAQKIKGDIATSFLDVELILLCDRSGSMKTHDVAILVGDTEPKLQLGTFTRYQVEDNLVKDLQREHEGKIMLVSFRDYAVIHVNGILPKPNGGTEMLKGLKKMLPYLVGDIRLILISDGEPSDDENAILNFAATHFANKLDTMFAGPRGSSGEAFLKKLAGVCAGQHSANVLAETKLLTERVNYLLSAHAH